MTTLERLVLGSPTGHPPADWTGARGRGAGVNLFVADCAFCLNLLRSRKIVWPKNFGQETARRRLGSVARGAT